MSTEAIQPCIPGLNQVDQYMQVLQVLPLLDKNTVASSLHNLEGRRAYAHTAGQVFRFLEQAYANTNRPVWLELKGILNDLEKWETYQVPTSNRHGSGKNKLQPSLKKNGVMRKYD